MRYVLIFVLTVFLLSSCDDASKSGAQGPDNQSDEPDSVGWQDGVLYFDMPDEYRDTECISFTPDGRYVCWMGRFLGETSESKYTLFYWDVKTGKRYKSANMVTIYDPRIEEVPQLYAMPGLKDSQIFCYWRFSTDSKLWIFDAAKGAFEDEPIVYDRPDNESDIMGMVLSPDRSLLAVSQSKMVSIYNTSDWSLVRVIKNDCSYGFMSLVFSYDNRYLAGSSSSFRACYAHMYDVQTGERKRTFKIDHVNNERNWISDLEFSPDGRHLACACGRYNARIWDIETGEFEELPYKGNNSIPRIYYLDGGDLILLDSDLCYLYDVKQKRDLGKLDYPRCARSGACVSLDEKWQQIWTGELNQGAVIDLPRFTNELRKKPLSERPSDKSPTPETPREEPPSDRE